ncbi:cyclin family [Rhizoctonia solani]|uniref:Cyclin family n=1 Tax=Rhizoctonia solani TaxID=456999 RepID=A0A8H7LIY5_9AGAM|nr:cyclin family [Rhizoctonia solani]KAF8760275.1 cyclin family [Rhizoctonia solani]
MISKRNTPEAAYLKYRQERGFPTMATDFWSSSHYRDWVVDRATVEQARALDLQYADQTQIALIGILFANVISKLCKKLNLKQQVVATATVYFRRFYIKNSYCETDPFFVASTCCYLAAKAEEVPIHLKSVVVESRTIYSNEYQYKSFPGDHSKLAEMEFYLLEDLDFDLIVFHPYRSLLALLPRYETVQESEAGELSSGSGSTASFYNDGERYWGTGEGRMEGIEDGAIQMAWFLINDTYRTDLCLIHPPWIIAVAALYLALVLHNTTRNKLTVSSKPNVNPMTGAVKYPAAAQNPYIRFLAGLNVSLPEVATVAQEMISIYALWDQLGEGSAGEAANAVADAGMKDQEAKKQKISEREVVDLLLRMRREHLDRMHPGIGQVIGDRKSG